MHIKGNNMKRLFTFFLSFLFLTGCLCSREHEELLKPVSESIYEEGIRSGTAEEPAAKEKKAGEIEAEKAALTMQEQEPAGKNITDHSVAKQSEDHVQKETEILSVEKDDPLKSALLVPAETVNKENTVMNFAFDSSSLTQKNKNAIAIFAREIKDKNYNVTIQGHTDSVGANEYNQKLSERRARAVKDELVKNGIDAGKIEVTGYGEDRPIADNSTAEGRAENRRALIFAEVN